ncbi:MAG: hypothetical protein DMG92_00730 [Acidobacteria bacterium]|nr:MAG: hypothetical protein DMG92_00730 [Acidobacteriota bacterium]
MKQLLGSLIVLAALALPALAQAPRMSPEDQQKFDNYYSRWVQDKQNGDRDDMVSSEHHMQDIMNRYSIPADTPYEQVASQNNPGYNRGYENRPYDNRGYGNQLQGDDQNKFNKEYTKWQEANARNDRDDIDKHARNMEQIMQRNGIPPNTPFNAIATSSGYAPRESVRQYQGRFSPDDQKKFDKAYEKFQRDRAKNDRDDYAKDEQKLNEIMAKYNIPRDVPYDVLVSGNRGY